MPSFGTAGAAERGRSPSADNAMKASTIQYRNEGGGLWVADVLTPVGQMEVIVNGTPEQPDEQEMLLVEKTLIAITENVRNCRRQLSYGFLYYPIRIAINTQHRAGIQFQHRLTKSKPLIFVEELRNK